MWFPLAGIVFQVVSASVADDLARLLALRTTGYSFEAMLSEHPEVAPFLACPLWELEELHCILTLPAGGANDLLQASLLASGRNQYPWAALQQSSSALTSAWQSMQWRGFISYRAQGNFSVVSLVSNLL